MISQLGQHCHSIPPFEEAFNNLQKFLREDFPKLINNIQNPSSSTLHESSFNKNVSCDNSEKQTCGSFSMLPVKYKRFISLN